ncbi:MAG: DUF2341 domain-containing protein [Bacteroidia bacterium]
MKKLYYLIPLFLLLFSTKMFAQPAGWSYSAPYQITENSGNLVVNYQAKLTINTQALVSANQLLANGNDLRFGKNCTGSTLYNYWIESGMNTANTVIWVKIDTLFPSAVRTFYMFYGNNTAAAVSAIPGVFNGPMSATDSTSNTSLSGSADAQRGFRFAPTEDVLVTAFGKSEPSANPRTITLFDFSTQAILSQQVVNGPSAQWSYQNIPSPIWVTQGTQYLLEIFFPSGDDAYYFGASPSTMGQHIFYFDMRYCNGCTPNTFPTNTVGGLLYGYVDMWYWTKNNPSVAPTINTGTFLSYSAPNQTVCLGDSVMVGTTATGGTGPYAYSWSPSSGLSSPNAGSTYASPAATSTYTVTVIDNTGCVATDNVMVTVNQLPIVAATAVNDSICPGDTATLYATGSALIYVWQPGPMMGIVVPVSPIATTTYTVTGSDMNGCTNSAVQTVTVVTTPSVSVTGNYSVVCDNAVNQLTLTGNGAATYDWNGGAGTGTTFTDTPSASQTYTVIGTNAFGCSDTANYAVTLIPSPVASATASTDSVCAGTCVTITGTANGGTAPYAYSWVPVNVTTSSFTACPTTTTCYTFFVTDVNGCSDAILYCVNVNPLPNMFINGPNSICNGLPGALSASGAASYTWANGSTLDTTAGSNVLANPSVTTTYTITGTSTEGCVDSTQYTLTVHQLPTVTYTSSLNTVCLNDGAVTLTGGSPTVGVYSGTGVSGGVFTPMVAGNGAQVITYTYSDANGCSAAATHTITVNACTGINETTGADGISVFPNPFSTFLAINRATSDEVTVSIFDAEGRLVMSKQTSGAKIEIETAELANGIYSLQLVDASGTKVFRVAKNN